VNGWRIVDGECHGSSSRMDDTFIFNMDSINAKKSNADVVPPTVVGSRWMLWRGLFCGAVAGYYESSECRSCCQAPDRHKKDRYGGLLGGFRAAAT